MCQSRPPATQRFRPAPPGLRHIASPSPAGGRVLVTGGTGFIGTTLARELADPAEQWVVLDNLHPQVHPGSRPPADLPDSADLRVGDVTSAGHVEPRRADQLARGLRRGRVAHVPNSVSGTHAQPINVYGDNTGDFVHIDDVVSALVAAIADPPTGHLRTVDIGSGVRTTIGDLAREVAREVARYHSAPEPHITGQFRDGDVRHASCTIEDTVKQLDWKPRVSLRDGVAGLQEWIATQLD